MSIQGQHLYWDTCVFIAHLNKETDSYGSLIDNIDQFLEEAKAGQHWIYTSTITIAEVTANFLERLVTAHLMTS